MAILKSQVFGQNLIGIYLRANNCFVFYPPNLLRPTFRKIKSVFEIPFYPATINNSNLLGAYMTGNDFGFIVPHILTDDELTNLKKCVDGSIQIGIIKSKDNAFGNLILCNNKGAIISPFLKEFVKEIEDVLNVETVVHEFAGYLLPGSISIANNKGCLVHPLSTDEEIEFISSILKVETDVSTVNRGIPYISSGAIVNDKSGIFGQDSTGPELSRLTSVLQL